MTWFSGPYSKLKSGWQHFREWERVVVLREKEWRFTVYRTNDEFKHYFDLQVSQVTRDDFFRRYDSLFESEAYGFCSADELAFKSPATPISKVLGGLTWGGIPKYYFHGTLKKTDGEPYIYGHYRASRYRSDKLLNWLNFLWLFLAITLIVPAAVLGISNPSDGVANRSSFGIEDIVGSFIFFGVLLLVPPAIYLEVYSRGTRAEAHRILSEICGSPPSRNVTK